MFTAVIAGVALTLTGFSPERGGHGRGGGHGDSDGGGGCSSSHSSSSSSGYHDYDSNNNNDYYDDDDYGSGDSGSSYAAPTPSAGGATVTLVSCASSSEPYATVEVTNSTSADDTFEVTVVFLNAEGSTLGIGMEKVDVAAYDRTTAQVDYTGSVPVSEVSDCEPEPEAEPAV